MTLPKNPNREKTYYKITNKAENHNGLQYHDGLVVDPKPFNSNPTASCVEGGIYFSTKECIHKFFGYGCWIRPVKIPEDARVVVNPNSDKYRTDKLFFEPREDFRWYFDNLFDKKTFPKSDYWILAKHCPDHFDKWFDKKLFLKSDYWILAKYCPNHFSKWFDKRSFPKEHYRALAKYCSDHFDKWFDKNTFPKKEYWRLALHCQKRFNKWFDKKLFPEKDYWTLEEYCQEYRNKWEDQNI